MLQQTIINNLKELVKITDYLASRGLQPAFMRGSEALYFSPISGETGTPSFSVNTQYNIFNCFSSGQRGDNITLVRILEKTDFNGAIRILQSFRPTDVVNLPVPMPVPDQEADAKHVIQKIVPIKSPSLIRYLETRGIPLAVAKNYLSQIHYDFGKNNYYGLGFKNDSGGFVIRTAGNFKGNIGKADITTLPQNKQNKCIYLFEGFFDFLSWLVLNHANTISFRGSHSNVIVTNSTSMINRLPDLSHFESILCYLDNDEAGNKAVMKLENMYPRKVYNFSALYYSGYKDLNEFLISNTPLSNGNKAATNKGSVSSPL